MRKYRLMKFHEFTLELAKFTDSKTIKAVYVTEKNQLTGERGNFDPETREVKTLYKKLLNLANFDPEHPNLMDLYCSYLVFCTLS